EPGPAALGGELLEAEDRGQELLRRRRVAFPELRAVQAADLLRGGYRTPVPGREGASRRRLDERHMQAVRIGERQHLLAEARLHGARLRPVALQTTSPELEAAGRHFEPDFHREAVSRTRRRHLRPWKEREV